MEVDEKVYVGKYHELPCPTYEFILLICREKENREKERDNIYIYEDRIISHKSQETRI